MSGIKHEIELARKDLEQWPTWALELPIENTDRITERRLKDGSHLSSNSVDVGSLALKRQMKTVMEEYDASPDWYKELCETSSF